MGKYFGTDGFRGEANKDLTVQHSFKVGRYLGYYYGKKNPEGKAKVVIGKDTRRSSYMFEYALVAGLTASGANVYLMHVTPTPSVSYIVRTDGFDCGIMISASHNPYYELLQSLNVGRSTICIDIGSVRIIIDHIGLCSECIKYCLCNLIGCTVCAVQSNSHILKGSGRDRHQVSHVTISSHGVINRASDIFFCSQRNLRNLTIDITLNLFFNRSL